MPKTKRDLEEQSYTDEKSCIAKTTKRQIPETALTWLTNDEIVKTSNVKEDHDAEKLRRNLRTQKRRLQDLTMTPRINYGSRNDDSYKISALE